MDADRLKGPELDIVGVHRHQLGWLEAEQLGEVA
jgi:hypothetical protein